MKTTIKYEQLSNPMKDEIKMFYDGRKHDNKDLTFEDSVEDWFDNEFEGWVSGRLKGHGHGRRTKDYSVATIAKDMRNTQRRKNFRFNIELPVKIAETVLESSRNHMVEAKRDAGIILNMSRGGLYFKTKEPMKVSSMVKVVIDFTKIDENLGNVNAVAMVVKVDKLEKGGYGNRVMFSKIDKRLKKNLNFYIFKSLAYHESQLFNLF